MKLLDESEAVRLLEDAGVKATPLAERAGRVAMKAPHRNAVRQSRYSR
jgi:hypothetical protein